jgi:phosphohistidine phosphatase
MKLFIVRHAWAGQAGDPRYPDDRLRPLTDEGRKRFARVVKALAGRGFSPKIIATSPLARCRQTAEIIAARLANGAEIVERDELAPGADLGDLWRWTVAQETQPVAWVGHAPDVGNLAGTLIGHAGSAIRFAKGAIAAIEFGEELSPGHGELHWLATAKVLGE